MIHKNRKWEVYLIDDVGQLASLLKNPNHHINCGFQFGKLLYLNDSLFSDKSYNYSVVLIEEETTTKWIGTQIEHISLVRKNEDDIKDIIKRYAKPTTQEKYKAESWAIPVSINKNQLSHLCSECNYIINNR